MDRSGKFAGENPFDLVRSWLSEAEQAEINDPNAMALATVDEDGMPNVRLVLLKDVEDDGFVFYTNYESKKAEEVLKAGKAAFVIHWKSLRRQIRVRGTVTKEDGATADAYFKSRSLGSRFGAWTSQQSKVLANREILEAEAKDMAASLGDDPDRPVFWGGFKVTPVEVEFWADGANRLHDRFRWRRETAQSRWRIERLYP